MPSKFRADWVLPIAGEPLENAIVTVDEGAIVEVGSGDVADARDLGRAVILPSLVNAHTHLELSYLHGAIPRTERFVDWIRRLMATRRDYPDPQADVIMDAARKAIAAARASGTGLIGEVTNTLVTAPLLRDANMPAHVFFELLGFNAPDPDERVSAGRARLEGALAGGLRGSVAPHAPYSVSPALFSAIRADLDRQEETVSTVHLGESPEEVELLRRGSGPWRVLLEELGVWDSQWKAPGTSPVQYLESLGFLDRRVLAVHGVQLSGDDLGRLRALNVTMVSCPRSNRYVGVGSPPLEAFYAMDVDVAFGTDSLASVDDLNMFAELAEARRIAPRVSAHALLRSATLAGAAALNREADYGSIEAGKRASLIAVRLPAGVTDVEECLVGGVAPEAVVWLE